MLSSLYALKKRNDEGFTLLELLIVVIIIGILAAIALPIFLNQQRAAVDASVKSDVHNTALQVQQWQIDHKNTPVVDALTYLNAGGKVTLTDNGNYVGLVVHADNTYDVCGYNAKGLNLIGPAASFVYDGATGHFGFGNGCYSAAAENPVSDGDGGSGSTGGNGGNTGTNGTGTGGTGTGGTGTGGTGTGGTGTGGTGTGTGTPGATPAGGGYHLDPKPGTGGTTDPKITDGGGGPGGSGNGGNTPTDPGPGGNPSGGTGGTGSNPSPSVPTSVSNGSLSIPTTQLGTNWVYYDDNDHSLGGVATFNAGGQYDWTTPGQNNGIIAWNTANGGAGAVADMTQSYDGTKSWHNDFLPNFTQAAWGFSFHEVAPGDTYIVSFQYKIVGDIAKDNLPRVVYSVKNADGSFTAVGDELVADGQWHQKRIGVPVRYDQINISGQTTGDSTGTGGTYIDNINIFKAS